MNSSDPVTRFYGKHRNYVNVPLALPGRQNPSLPLRVQLRLAPYADKAHSPIVVPDYEPDRNPIRALGIELRLLRFSSPIVRPSRFSAFPIVTL